MTLVLDLPTEIEDELRITAAAQGVAVEAVAVEWLRLRARQPFLPPIVRKMEDLETILALGERLTSGTPPLRDDAVARSYRDAE